MPGLTNKDLNFKEGSSQKQTETSCEELHLKTLEIENSTVKIDPCVQKRQKS